MMGDVKHVTAGDGTVRVAEYLDLDRARAAAERWGDWIVMGDHDDDTGVYWTCRPRDAERLARVGYEIVTPR